LNTATNSFPIPVICLFGPTAVGKTDLLEELFTGTGEIISADSMQVYRRMDIGTAKPDKSTLTKLPHHLVDILEYTSQFNAGDFVKLADAAVREINSRGRIPVVSGGTAFYFRNFLFGLPPIPAVPEGLRESLMRRKDKEGLKSLWDQLVEVDPLSAERIEPGDSSRIIRALEIFLGTGTPLSSFPLPRVPREEFRCLMLGLRRDREELYRRIDRRVDIMFDQGLDEEVFSLLKEGATFEDPGMKGIGYSEFAGVIRNGCLRMNDVRQQIKQDSRRYAKRQMTFFKSLPGLEWFHPEEKGKIRERITLFHKNALDH
jgi:tRNA dimethylallyltransferase